MANSGAGVADQGLSTSLLGAFCNALASDVQRAFIDGEGGFMNCLGQRWMGMYDACEIFGACMECHRDDRFGD